MNETYVRNQVRKIFVNQFGYWVHTITDGIRCPHGTILVPQSGRPDLLATHPVKPPIRIEVKVVKTNKTGFALDSISDVQRAGMNKRVDFGFLVYLALGIIEIRERSERLQALYLVPWIDWLTVEEKIRSIQKTVPICVQAKMRREIQDGNLDIEHLLVSWSISKAKRGWEIPTKHPLFEIVK